MKNIKLFINVLISSILLSAIIFDTIEINIIQYYLFMFSMWILLFINYNMKKNLKIFDLFIIVSLGNFSSYVLIKILDNKGFNKNILWIICFLSIISIISNIFYSNKKEVLNESENLFFKRKRDLERLSNYLDMFDIVGINAMWGAGKSFLVDKLKENIKEEYEIIEIDILACNFNELQLILIKEIEKVMYRNKIVSKYSNKLKDFLANGTIISRFKNLIFTTTNSFSETIKEFQNELNKIDKKIVIIYEDIDRISDEGVIKNIFALSEKLSNENIKIIYQYHEEKLKELGFSPIYLEKYIQFKMNLTEINFFEILALVFQENNFDKNIIQLDDFNFLKEYSQKNRNNSLEKELGINKTMYFKLSNISIRRVKNFLKELNGILKYEEYENHKETVISFFILKHFISTEYEKLNIEEGLLETFKFKVNSKSYTITELINIYKSDELGGIDNDFINKVFSDEENKNIEQNLMNYCILKLFDYNCDINNQINNEGNVEKRLKLIVEESIDLLEARNDNVKKDQLIWNLLANGKSKYTDYEYVGNEFIEDVLNQPEDKRDIAYEKFKDRLFKEDLTRDNETIFKLGVPRFIELFKSFRVLNVTSKKQISLIDFYFRNKEIDVISKELIQNMNYCGLKTNKEYIHILNKISKLNVIGNLNFEDCFAKFLKKFIGALSRQGYINTINYYMINNEKIIEKDNDEVIKELRIIIEKINKLKDEIIANFEFEELEYDLNVIIKFLNKMIVLINYENKFIDEKRSFFNTEMKSIHMNQKEFDRLKNIEDKDDFREELRKSYLNEEITAHEIKELLDS